jgi:hypothetical protein
LGGLRGTDFFFKVYMLVTIQYFLATFGIWFATGDSLPEEFKEAYHNHTLGIISMVLLVILWLACYFLQFLPKEVQNKEAWWWWPVYGVYVVVFSYSAGYISANNVLEINFLFTLYVTTSFAGVFIYAMVAHILRWYLRIGYMIITVVVFNYVSWTIMHYAGLTDAGFTANLLAAGSAGTLVILGLVFTAVVLEDGFRYKEGEWVYAACVFIVETLIVVFLLLSSLYVQPRKPFIAKSPVQILEEELRKDKEKKEEKEAKKEPSKEV